jgi:hypothetical protein
MFDKDICGGIVLVKSDVLPDWYVIERKYHSGYEGWEKDSENSYRLVMASRISDASVEGSLEEMKSIANAIITRTDAHFKRCAVESRGDVVFFYSPRNSQEYGNVPYEDALEFAQCVMSL